MWMMVIIKATPLLGTQIAKFRAKLEFGHGFYRCGNSMCLACYNSRPAETIEAIKAYARKFGVDASVLQFTDEEYKNIVHVKGILK